MVFLIKDSLISIALISFCSVSANGQQTGHDAKKRSTQGSTGPGDLNLQANHSLIGRVSMKFKNDTSQRIIVRGYYNLPFERKYFELTLKSKQTKGIPVGSPTLYYHAYQPNGKMRWQGRTPMRVKAGTHNWETLKMVRYDMHKLWRKVMTVRYLRMPSKEVVFSE